MCDMKTILFNPQSCKKNIKKRFPTALGELSASLDGCFEFDIVDGNIEKNPLLSIERIIADSGSDKIVLCISVMPGYQVVQAIDVSKRVKEKHPQVIVIWGGFFASSYPKTILNSKYVDVVIIGQGERTLVELLNVLQNNLEITTSIQGIVFKKQNKIYKSQKREMHPMLEKNIPYEKFKMNAYLNKSGIGEKTLYVATSMGCPSSCSFCGIKSMYNGKSCWVGMNPEVFRNRLNCLKKNNDFDSIQFVDADQFADVQWSTSILNIVKDLGLTWRGYGKIEFLAKQSDEYWEWLRSTNCKCIFMGAESADANAIHSMSKKISVQQTLDVASKCAVYGIVPEFSFIFCSPNDTMESLNNTISFIRKIKEICPRSNIIIYFYSSKQSDNMASLEDFTKKEKYNLMVWNNPNCSNVDKKVVRRSRDFRQVLYAYSPKITDFTNTDFKVWLFKKIAKIRFENEFYSFPIELKLLDWMFNITKVE